MDLGLWNAEHGILAPVGVFRVHAYNDEGVGVVSFEVTDRERHRGLSSGGDGTAEQVMGCFAVLADIYSGVWRRDDRIVTTGMEMAGLAIQISSISLTASFL